MESPGEVGSGMEWCAKAGEFWRCAVLFGGACCGDERNGTAGKALFGSVRSGSVRIGQVCQCWVKVWQASSGLVSQCMFGTAIYGGAGLVW